MVFPWQPPHVCSYNSAESTNPRSIAASLSMGGLGLGGDAVPTRKKKDVPKHVKDFLQKESVVEDVFENIPTVDDFVVLQGSMIKQQRRQMKNEIYVRGIPWEMENDELRDVFTEFKPKYGRAMKTENGTRSLGFGFVGFPTEAQAQAAIQAMNGKELPKKDGGVTKIAVSLSFERAPKPKERQFASVRTIPLRLPRIKHEKSLCVCAYKYVCT
jgi:hypothetical protein